MEKNAQVGKNVYVDRDIPLTDLPADLVGADWVQAAEADSLYPAEDLMEISAADDTVVSVAHDDRLPRPKWLRNLFKPSGRQMTINGRPKTIFQRHVGQEESLTLGQNVENSKIKSADMYVVFIGPEQVPPSKQSPSGERVDAK